MVAAGIKGLRQRKTDPCGGLYHSNYNSFQKLLYVKGYINEAQSKIVEVIQIVSL